MKTRRILSAIIAVVLVLSCIGTITLAADEKPAELVNSLYKLNTSKTFKVGYIGGSVTVGTGVEEGYAEDDYSWRGLTREWFKSTFRNKNIVEVSRALGGTGSIYGVYRIEDDILNANPDILFIEMSINDHYDGIYNKDENYVYVETMVRKAYAANPYVDIVFIVTGANAQLKQDATSAQPVWGEPYTKIAEHYDIPVIYVGRELARKIYAENGNKYPAQTDAAWTKYFSDMVHPKVAGYQEYANTIISFLEENLVTGYKPTEADRIDYTKAENYDVIYCEKNGKDNGVISVNQMMNADLVRTDGAGFKSNTGSFWRTSQNGHPVLTSSPNTGSTATFTFTSPNLSAWIYAFGSGTYAPGTKVHYTIDGGEVQTLEIVTSSNINCMINFATDLEPGEHTIRIVHDASTPAPFRIFYFLTWGEGATSEMAAVPYYKFEGEYSVNLDGMSYSDFTPSVKEYEICVGENGAYPTLSFTAQNYYGYEVTQADKDGVAKLKIDNGDEYTFKFVKKAKAENITVKFDLNGAPGIANQEIKLGDKVAMPATPARNNYVFDGWYKDAAFTERYYFGTAMPQYNTTIYARWLTASDVAQRMVLTIDKTEATVFGKTVTNDVAPIIRNGRTMLPARFVAENLGAEIEWDEVKRRVTVKKGDLEIILTIDSDKAQIKKNGVTKTVTLDSPAFIENSRTYTPVRFIVENLGAKIEWREDERQVVIVK